MPSASLTRRISFSAAHRYSRPEWSAEKNASTFGACAWPNFHGHSYVCDITVSGPIDDQTGFVVDLGVLDRILKEQVKDRFDHRNINLDVTEFGDGKLVPTGENLARYIFGLVDKDLPKPARVMRVTVGEDDSLSATYSRE
ncbi:MAG TPA: 6-carboxytetrahydropterin synthase [Gemmatimonadaceae bacterium]|jgi:6-pyruvoyltetrahydropterin/6-carboxytetrahydropterin synthase|nr:6-carboxytetrahydropterin synthase [Gemmatimonadaceae bacterium]